jgi:hypothetical protein
MLKALLTLCSLSMALAGTGLYMGPYFRDPQPLNFTVHKNNAAYLPCEVRQLGDKKVSPLACSRKLQTRDMLES